MEGAEVHMRRGFTLVELMIVVAVIGILAGIALRSYRAQQCKAQGTEAAQALHAVAALEAQNRAEKDTYANVSAACPNPPVALGVGCIKYSSKGNHPRFTVSAAGAATTYLATAAGIAGSTMAGAVWRADQSGAISDVAGICGTLR